MPATRGDIDILRALSRAFHMIDDPNELAEAAGDACGAMLRFWAMPKADQEDARALSAEFGPERARDACQTQPCRLNDRRNCDDCTFPAPTMIKTNGIDMAVYEAGPKDGLPVVLCHGFPELAYSWRHQLPALAAAGLSRASRPISAAMAGPPGRKRSRTTTWRI